MQAGAITLSFDDDDADVIRWLTNNTSWCQTLYLDVRAGLVCRQGRRRLSFDGKFLTPADIVRKPDKTRLPSSLRQDHPRMCAFSYACSLPVT